MKQPICASARAISSCLVALLAACADSTAPEQPNVLLISIDTLRGDRLGAYGYPRPVSPAIDQFAADGVVFEQAIAQAPWTAPSHASFLTSLYPSQLRLGTFLEPGRIHGDAVTLAEALRERGFATAALVAGGFVRKDLGFDQGFDTFEEGVRTMRATVDKALGWLDGRAGERAPFFLFLHTYDVHKYYPPDDERARFVRPYSGPLKIERALAAAIQRNDNHEWREALGPADMQLIGDLYDASVAAVDAEIGRLLQALRERGLFDSTVIAITSDHGEEFLEHGRTGHGFNLYDENLRVPLILRHPRLAPARVAAQVRLLDLAPTLAELAGVPRPPSWQGVSLLPYAAGATDALLPAFAEAAHVPQKAVRTPEHKFIIALHRPRHRWYDLGADPLEQQNGAGSGGAAELRMRSALGDWIRACGLDVRYVGAGAADTGPEAAADLRELGYTGSVREPGGSAEEFLRVLQNARMRRDGSLDPEGEEVRYPATSGK